jgi:hypothetical protein
MKPPFSHAVGRIGYNVSMLCSPGANPSRRIWRRGVADQNIVMLDVPPVSGTPRLRNSSFRAVLYQQLLDAVPLHCVGNCPDRLEPRYLKRRSKRYAELKMPGARPNWLLKGVSKD